MYCPKCGAQIADDASFCVKCGNRLGNIAESPQEEVSHKQRCIHCGSSNIRISTSTKTVSKGGGFSASKGCLGYLLLGPAGILCGACGSNAKTVSTDTKKWLCSDCGKDFETEEELNKQLQFDKMFSSFVKGLMILLGVLAGLTAVLGVVAGIDGEDEIMTIFIIMGAICAAICPLMLLPRKSMRKDMQVITEKMETLKKYSDEA